MLLIDNDDVEALLTAQECVEVLEQAYRDEADGTAAQVPSGGRFELGCASEGDEAHRSFVWAAMAGLSTRHELMAVRQKLDIHFKVQHEDGRQTQDKYCIRPGTYCGFVLLVSTRNAEPLALVNDGVLQHHRVAATAAVAARHMAREDARRLGIIGTGGMARSHAAMLCAVRDIEQLSVYSPNPEHVKDFASAMEGQLQVPVEPASSVADVLSGADLVAFCTDATDPIVEDGSWLTPGVHFSNVLPKETGRSPDSADVIVVHGVPPAAAVRLWASREGDDRGERWAIREVSDWRKPSTLLPTLQEVVSGRSPGRRNDSDITYFDNYPGNGLQFVALGALLLERAREQGAGKELPTEFFTQSVRN